MEIEEIAGVVNEVRASFDAGKTKSYDWRRSQLKAIIRLVDENTEAIVKAVQTDLGKPQIEAWSVESNLVRKEAQHSLKRLKKWMRVERVKTPLFAMPASSRIVREPLGVVLVIAPWNYPFNLIFGPLIGAIAAGNSVVMKPSELTVETSKLIAELVPKYLDNDCIRVVEGAVEETTELLAQRFDHILYTGNGHVGRIIMAAAVKHLTPVTLELGGKSPVYVDKNVDLDMAARRIVWTKFFNAGQTCIAPDYILAHTEIHDALLEKLAACSRRFYGDDPQQSDSFARIVNTRHHKRLSALMNSGEIVSGGRTDEATRYIEPTILKNVGVDDPVMAEEIFGPLLPVLKTENLDSAITFINERPKPLAIYSFSRDPAVAKAILGRTSSGGMCINHCVLHFSVTDLPFGGVGESGMGAYHGRAGFETFSHRRAVVKKPLWLDPPIAYPPYTSTKTSWIKRLL